MGYRQRVLYVDDHDSVGKALLRVLRGRGWDADWRDSAEMGFVAMVESSYDLLLLDWRMPGLSGVSACRAYRRRFPECPIIVFTIAEEITERLAAFDAGADDYVLKDAHVDELCARMRAALRRSGAAHALANPAFGELVVDLRSYRLYGAFGATPLVATTNQIRFLVPLFEAEGAGVQESALIQLIYEDLPSDPHNSVCVLAASVRKLLEPTRVRLAKDNRVYSLLDLDARVGRRAALGMVRRSGGG